MIEERAAIMCSKRMRSTVAKKGCSSLEGGMEDIVRKEDSPSFGRAESDGERDL